MERVGKLLENSILQRSVDAEATQHAGERRSQVASKHPQVIHRSVVQAGPKAGEAVSESSSKNKENESPRRRRRLGVRTDLTKVKAILSSVLNHRGLDKRVERYEFILHWPEIVGERLAEVSKPEYIRDKALVVQVLHPAWAQELTMIKPVLLESLAQYLKPGDVVRDMVFRVGSFS